MVGGRSQEQVRIGTRTKSHRDHFLPLADAALALIEASPHHRDFFFGDGPRRRGDKQRGLSMIISAYAINRCTSADSLE
jgi:hypothetical protein